MTTGPDAAPGINGGIMGRHFEQPVNEDKLLKVGEEEREKLFLLLRSDGLMRKDWSRLHRMLPGRTLGLTRNSLLA